MSKTTKLDPALEAILDGEDEELFTTGKPAKPAKRTNVLTDADRERRVKQTEKMRAKLVEKQALAKAAGMTLTAYNKMLKEAKEKAAAEKVPTPPPPPKAPSPPKEDPREKELAEYKEELKQLKLEKERQLQEKADRKAAKSKRLGEENKQLKEQVIEHVIKPAEQQVKMARSKLHGLLRRTIPQ